jgi:protein ERP2
MTEMDILSNYNSSIQNMRAPSSRRKSTLLLNINHLIYFVTLTILFRTTRGVELTFELPDNAKECFYEVIEEGKTSTVEFQVVTGGQYDVDVIIEGPQKNKPQKTQLYKQVKKQYDSFTWTADVTGEYRACFSNEFSTFSHKLVYVDFQVGEEEPLPGVGDHLTAMTQMESSAQEVHENLNSVVDYQTHHRLRETQGRKRAEDLNERIMVWSAFVTVAIFVVGFGQVLVLKSFFSEKKPSQMYGYH